jgi:hypothetical protein
MKIAVVYKTLNKKTGHFYVGVHSTYDLCFGTSEFIDDYIGSGKLIRQALKKYGRDAFDVEVIAYFDQVKYAYDAERYIVTEEFLDTHKGRTYNLVFGGNMPPMGTHKDHKHTERFKLSMRGKNNVSKRPDVRQINSSWHIQNQIAKRPSVRKKQWQLALARNSKPPRDQRHIGANKGYRWINNGENNAMIKPKQPLLIGWSYGRML